MAYILKFCQLNYISNEFEEYLKIGSILYNQQKTEIRIKIT